MEDMAVYYGSHPEPCSRTSKHDAEARVKSELAPRVVTRSGRACAGTAVDEACPDVTREVPVAVATEVTYGMCLTQAGGRLKEPLCCVTHCTARVTFYGG